MKRKLKVSSGLYSYLHASGVLNTGNENAIALARKEYWRNYKKVWRKEKRKKEKEITISLNTEELKVITQSAKIHQRNVTAFIKESAFAYINKRYIVPSQETVHSIRQLLAMLYNQIEQLLDENKLQSELGNELKQKITELERFILPVLFNPKIVEKHIEELVRKEPIMKTKLLALLNNL
jgi:uncharacterized protein (DUF1778 family)